MDIDRAAEEITEPLFHPSLPYLRSGEFTPIQTVMTNTVDTWLRSYPLAEQVHILGGLTREGVLEHRNERSSGLHDKPWIWEQSMAYNAEGMFYMGDVRKSVKGEGYSAGPFQRFTKEHQEHLMGPRKRE